MLRVLGGIVVWIVILFGANTLAFSIAGLVARFRAGHDGGVMYMDLRTPTYLGAVITVAVSCLIVAAGIGVRVATSRRRAAIPSGESPGAIGS